MHGAGAHTRIMPQPNLVPVRLITRSTQSRACRREHRSRAADRSLRVSSGGLLGSKKKAISLLLTRVACYPGNYSGCATPFRPHLARRIELERRTFVSTMAEAEHRERAFLERIEAERAFDIDLR